MKESLISNKLSREEFMRISWALLLVPFFWLWYSLVKRQKSDALNYEEIYIRSDLSLGITFKDGIIAIKGKRRVVFLTSRCTHLGCKITSFENNTLICPCHGSRFSLEGRNLARPATKPLAVLIYRTDEKTGDYIVKVPTE